MNLFIGKKGTVFHYALISIFAALGIAFLLFNQGVGVETIVLGQWENNFVEQYILEGEEVQLQEDLLMNYLLLTAIETNSLRGGHASSSLDTLDCGSSFDLPLLNDGNSFCFASYSEEISLELTLLVEEEKRTSFDEFSLELIENELFLSSDEGISILPGDATLDLSSEEISCLTEGNFPIVSSEGEYSSCDSCSSDSTCENYLDQFYCDLDPCNVGCVSYYEQVDVDYEFSSCGLCPEEAECNQYISQYYCEQDTCSLGCSWDVNSCIDSGETNVTKESLDILEKARIVSNPDILTENTAYSLDYAITFDLSLYSEDYTAIALEAYTLFYACNGYEDLEECLEREKYSNWYFGDCETEAYQEENRNVAFCVKSPSSLSLSYVSSAQVLEYTFALDFTPSESFVVSGVEVGYDSSTNVYDIYFEEQETATAYRVYVTDYALPSFEGSSSEFELQRFNSDVFDYVQFSVEDIVDSCPEPAEIGVAYDCLGSIRYPFYSDDLIVQEDYYFAVTSLIGEEESQISGFVNT